MQKLFLPVLAKLPIWCFPWNNLPSVNPISAAVMKHYPLNNNNSSNNPHLQRHPPCSLPVLVAASLPVVEERLNEERKRKPPRRSWRHTPSLNRFLPRRNFTPEIIPLGDTTEGIRRQSHPQRTPRRRGIWTSRQSCTILTATAKDRIIIMR